MRIRKELSQLFFGTPLISLESNTCITLHYNSMVTSTILFRHNYWTAVQLFLILLAKIKNYPSHWWYTNLVTPAWLAQNTRTTQQQQLVFYSGLKEEDIIVFLGNLLLLELLWVVQGTCTAVVLSGRPGGTSIHGVTKISGLLLVDSSVIPNLTSNVETKLLVSTS